MSSDFVHLHVHTEYSVLDGANKLGELLERCKIYDMPACAITDHGCLFGAVDFYIAATKAGIKPIIGSELYVAKGSRFDKTARSSSDAYYHLLLLCENETGYHNLCRLSSAGYIEGFRYKPRIDDELLEEHKEGLICLSACLGGEVPQKVLNGKVDAASDAVAKYVNIFGKDNFFIELMDHGMPEEREVNPVLINLAKRHGVGLVATNDSHYLDRSDAGAHEALLCIQTNSLLDDDKHFKFPSDGFHFCSPDEMRAKFADVPEAITNTRVIADRCNVKLKLGGHLIPKYVPPEGMGKEEYLRHLVYLGLEDRYKGHPSPEHRERADFELDIIERMHFVDYFLVVWDLIAHARAKGIAVGPGRGSGAGSLVAYALEITNIDPMRYGLLFERFLNPDRVSMPDFDLDFCYIRREEVIEYVREKYGEANVSQIITFGRMLAKQVVRNVARVLGMPYADADRIAKLIPDELKIKLEKAIRQEPELKRLVDGDPQVKRLWELATRLEGTIGNCGTHAAGVVICDEPLTNHVALFKASNSTVVATQVEMRCVEEVGLLKMDFLGLRTLTVVHEAVRLVKENCGVEINVDYLEPDDAAAYALLRSGKTTGVFQLESSGMRDLAKRIGLESLEEICALVALYRPGPMQFIDQYISSKHHPEKIHYDHPLLEPILKETYGVALYQEQVMQVVQAIAGFSLGQADILRRAMGKKKVALMEEQRGKFLEGAAANNIDKGTAEVLFGKIEQFAGYGFNKSHSMAYAFVAYQTAFLKANYPVEFMTALLSSESGNLDKVALYVDECRRMEIKVLPPDVNKSCFGFAVEGRSIRFGMGAVKNLGEGPVEAIVSEREADGPFKDIFDFCRRVDSRGVNRRAIESLNKAGAFVCSGWNRREVDASLETALSEGQLSQRERESGQTSLFDLMDASGCGAVANEKPELDDWPEAELLVMEKEVLGFYISSHPLERHRETLARFMTVPEDGLDALEEDEEVVIGGLITAAKQHVTSKGSKMAFVTVDGGRESYEITVFPDTYEEKSDLIQADLVVFFAGRLNVRNGERGVIATNVVKVEDAEKVFTRALHLRLDTASLSEDTVVRLAETLGAREGTCDVYLHCMLGNDAEVMVLATDICRVMPSAELKHEVEELIGEGNVWCAASSGLGIAS